MRSVSGIPYSAMQSGTWKIIVQGSQIAVQRIITLTVGVPQTVVITVCNPPKPVQLSVALTNPVKGYPDRGAGNHKHTEGPK